MATPSREQLAKKLMQQAQIPSGQLGPKRSDKAHHLTYPQRANRLLRPVSRTEEELQQREQGWNDRFFYEEPSKAAKLARSDRNAATASSPDALKQKEKKIQDERAHYGGAHRRRIVQDKKPANNGRLLPLGFSSGDTATNAATPASKEERLRFKVLKSIDTRETLLYQLNALILCTPVQENLFHPSRPTEPFKTGRPGLQSFKPKSGMALAPNSSVGNNSMTSSREATKMAQQIAMDIQIAGIQCVEALVEWMLEAGATSDKPPPFLWRGRNYFLKMYEDLDFAGGELQARGVVLDCYSKHNPLLIRPDQKLGRVLAAQSIITEMVEGAAGSTMMPVLVQCDPKRSEVVSTRSSRFESDVASAEKNYQSKDDDEKPALLPAAFRENAPDSAKPHLESADMMIFQTEYDMDSVRSTHSDDDLLDKSLDQNKSSLLPFSLTLTESEPERELIDILDESISVFTALSQPNIEAIQAGTEKTQANNQKSNQVDQVHESEMKEPAVEECLMIEQNPQPNLTVALYDEIKNNCEHFDSTPALKFEAVDCKYWHGAQHSLRESLEASNSLRPSLVGSFFSIIEHYQLMISPTSALSFMGTDTVKKLDLVSCLWGECMWIVDEIFGYIVEQVQSKIEKVNSLVSELGIDDLIEFVELTLERLDEAIQISSQVFQIMILILKYNASEPPSLLPRRSEGFNRLLLVFYPYLVSQARENLTGHWKSIVDLFTSVHVNIVELSFLMDFKCKVLLMNGSPLSTCYGDTLRESPDVDDGSSQSFPKLVIVCDRLDVLTTSVDCVWSKCLSRRLKQRFAVFPFFLSSFGEKMVNEKRVEEGEGKGPLKEWFILIAHALTSKWENVTICSSTVHNDQHEVAVNENKLTTPAVTHLVQPGFRIEWTSCKTGEIVSRVVNECLDDKSVLLDRGVYPEVFPVSQLRISRPQHAYLEYKGDTERFWLNEQTEDTPENRRVLCFMGWFMANAIAHFTIVDVRVHRLLFHLLLNTEYAVSLDDAMQLDPTWHEALVQTKAMPTPEWIGFLEMEGLSETMTNEDYIEHVLSEKFGSILWQVQEFRSGFECVLPIVSLQAAGIDADDLVAIICGPGDALDTNFRVDQVFRVSSDPDFISSGPLHRAFWTTVNSFDATKKRKFVKFVTGVETLPLPGTEFLRIEMPFAAITAEDNKKLLQMLPQSHTCDNTLELPHYWRALCWRDQQNESSENADLEQELAVLLRSKLELAIEEASSGYGLDATHEVAGVLHSDQRSGSAGSAAEESYESLDLPALDVEEENNSHAEKDAPPDDEQEPQDLASVINDPTTLQEAPVPSTPAAVITADEDYEENYDDWEEEENAEE